MPTPDFIVKRGDTGPPLEATLQDAAGNPADLTAATEVRFQMAPAGGGTATVDAVAVVVAPTDAGTVRYDWQVADTSVAGYYRAEWRVTFPAGLVRTYPNAGSLLVLVAEQVA